MAGVGGRCGGEDPTLRRQQQGGEMTGAGSLEGPGHMGGPFLVGGRASRGPSPCGAEPLDGRQHLVII